jgi:hypothetical protein
VLPPQAQQVRTQQVPAGPAYVPPAGTPPAPPAEPDENRRKFPLVPIAIVLLVLAVGVGSFLLWPKGGGNQNNAQPPTGSQTGASTPSNQPTSNGQSQSQQPADSQTQPPPNSETNPPASTPSQAPPPPAGPKNAQEAITAYYALIPGDLQTGWTLLTDSFKAGRLLTYDGYQSFWRNYTSVQLSNFVPQGDNAVTVTLQYMQGANVAMTETPTFTFVQQNGKWLINSQG